MNSYEKGDQLIHVSVWTPQHLSPEEKAMLEKLSHSQNFKPHPDKNEKGFFEKIRERGYFFTYVGSLQDNNTTHLPLAAEAVGISCDLYPQIPHISSAILGFNMQNINAVQLLDAWYGVTEEVYPNMTWWPEELSLSVAAWYIGCRPLDWLGAVLCEEDELAHLEHRPTVQLYLDKLR